MAMDMPPTRCRPPRVTPHRARRWAFLLLACTGVHALAPGPAHAQLSRLDKATLIDGLTREGMTELLLHLARTEPTDDPVLTEQIKIAQHQIHFADVSRPAAERAAAFSEALEGLRRLIDEHADHEQRPLWQTDLAELLLFEYLGSQQRNAAEFYEFGVPTAEQRAAFESATVEAFEHLADADYRFVQLQGELPRQPDHVARRIDTGLWDRMMNTYYNTRTQFLLAHAAWFVTLLGDDHPYFGQLGRNRRVRDQEQEIAAERLRLLEVARERLEGVIREGRGGPAIERRCRVLLGRVLRCLGDMEGAAAALEQARAAKQADVVDLVAALGLALVEHQAGATGGALDALVDLEGHAFAREHLVMRLLVVDLQHRLLLAAARQQPEAKRAAAVAEAFETYQSLFGDPDLKSQAEALRFYVYRRWEASLTDAADLGDLPDVVLLAIGEIARADAQDRINAAVEAERAGDEAKAAALTAQAGPRLQRAATVLSALLQRKGLSKPTRAGALYNQGWVAFLQDVSSTAATIEAARIWVEAASAMPDQPAAEQAITQAVERLRHWHGQAITRREVDAAYKAAAAVLFAKFPTTPAADRLRYYHGAFVLVPEGRIEEAKAVFEGIPPGHPDYFLARKELLYALLAMHGQAEEARRTAIAVQLRKRAEQLRSEAGRALERAEPTERAVIANAAGHARLVLAELALAEGDARAAVDQLRELAAQHAEDQELVGRSLSRRILALAAAGELEAALADARDTIERFPDEAAGVIDRVLDDLEVQIDMLRARAAETRIDRDRAELAGQAKEASRTASQLAAILFEWAGARNFADDQMLPFRLRVIKTMRLGGDPAGALEALQPLLEDATFREDAEVVHHAGEIYYALGGRENHIKASRYYRMIITSFGQPPFPPMYWNAWMRWFQILDQLGEQTGDIPLRVRVLRRTDPQLGGTRFRREMERLENKYGR